MPLSVLKKGTHRWLVLFVLVTGFLVRYMNLMSLSTGHDHAFLIFWSRMVSEASELGFSPHLIQYLFHGSSEQIISYLLAHQNSLLYALLYGLYENPEKVTRIVDVVILALWFKLVGYGILQARILSMLFQLGTVWMTYLLTEKITGSRRCAFLSFVLMAFLPMSVLFSRFVSWHTFGSFFFIIAVYSAIGGIEKRIREGKRSLLYLSSLLGGVAVLSNTLIPCLLPFIIGGYVWSSAQGRVGEKVKLLLEWLWPGMVLLLPAVIFLAIRCKEFYQRNIGYDYWNQSFYDKVMIQLGSWSDIIGVPLMVCAIGGVVLALKMVKEHRVYAVPLLWIFSQFALFSFISTETLFRAHLNALPPLVFFASLGMASIWNGVEMSRLFSSHKVFLRVGVATLFFLLVLPCAVRLWSVLKNPYHNPFHYGNYEEYLHPLKAEVALVEYIEHRLPPGSVLFISSHALHSMNILLSDLKKYTFVNLTALYLNHRGKSYRDHVERWYPGYQEVNPHFLVTAHADSSFDFFSVLEPSAHCSLMTTIHEYKLFQIRFNPSSAGHYFPS